MKETDLFEPLQTYLYGQGYQVSSEVHGCDLIARRKTAHEAAPDSDDFHRAGQNPKDATADGTMPDDSDFIVIELKTRMTLDLVVQAARRKEVSESVYVAVPVHGAKGTLRNMNGVRLLLRRLQVGLILVRFLRSWTRIEVVLHPQPFHPRIRQRAKQRILREIDGRFAEFNKAGEPATTERITTYKQHAVHVAWLLSRLGPSSPAQLRAAGADDRAQTILSANHYGWFVRLERGVYHLHPAGHEALTRYRKLTELFSQRKTLTD